MCGIRFFLCVKKADKKFSGLCSDDHTAHPNQHTLGVETPARRASNAQTHLKRRASLARCCSSHGPSAVQPRPDGRYPAERVAEEHDAASCGSRECFPAFATDPRAHTAKRRQRATIAAPPSAAPSPRAPNLVVPHLRRPRRARDGVEPSLPSQRAPPPLPRPPRLSPAGDSRPHATTHATRAARGGGAQPQLQSPPSERPPAGWSLSLTDDEALRGCVRTTSLTRCALARKAPSTCGARGEMGRGVGGRRHGAADAPRGPRGVRHMERSSADARGVVATKRETHGTQQCGRVRRGDQRRHATPALRARRASRRRRVALRAFVLCTDCTQYVPTLGSWR